MAKSAIVFACSNPLPEIWPWDAREAGARIVGTGRGDFPNQINNSLGFPAIFRGTLDVRARTIPEGMALAAAGELARFAEGRGIHEDDIIPRMDEWEVFPREAVTTAMKAQDQGITRLSKTQEQLYDCARKVICDARETTQLLMKERYIPQAP